MKFLSFRHVLIGLCMIAGAGLAVAMKPSEKLADQAQFDLETLVPSSSATGGLIRPSSRENSALDTLRWQGDDITGHGPRMTHKNWNKHD